VIPTLQTIATMVKYEQDTGRSQIGVRDDKGLPIHKCCFPHIERKCSKIRKA
jgi:hypothetical protein